MNKMSKKEFNEICKANGLHAFANNDYEMMLNMLSQYKHYQGNNYKSIYNEDNTREWANRSAIRSYTESDNIYEELNSRGYYDDLLK